MKIDNVILRVGCSLSANRTANMSISYICFCVIAALFYLVDGAPHKDVYSLNQELQQSGFKVLTSEDDFQKSLTCTACGIKLTYQDSAKAMWLIKRHAGENSHKVKSGWYLDAKNKVLSSKPKGMDSV